MHQGYSRNQPVESMELGWSWLENTRAPPHVDFGTFARIIITMSARESRHLNTSCFGTLAEMTDTVSLENSLVHSHLTVHITVVFSLCSNSRSAINFLSTALDCAISPSNTGDKTASSGTVGSESASLGALLLSMCKRKNYGRMKPRSQEY